MQIFSPLRTLWGITKYLYILQYHIHNSIDYSFLIFIALEKSLFKDKKIEKLISFPHL